jgi:hypothetical protein
VRTSIQNFNFHKYSNAKLTYKLWKMPVAAGTWIKICLKKSKQAYFIIFRRLFNTITFCILQHGSNPARWFRWKTVKFTVPRWNYLLQLRLIPANETAINLNELQYCKLRGRNNNQRSASERKLVINPILGWVRVSSAKFSAEWNGKSTNLKWNII